MTRKKVKLAYITNDSARKATFKKRKKGFLKKMYELTTLCEIKACAIMYSPFDAQPEVWPNPKVAQCVLGEFRRLPEMEKSKKMVNQEAFLRQRINKASEQMKKQQKDNREKEMTEVMFQCLMGKNLQSLNIVDLNDVGWLIDQNLKEIYNRIETLKKEGAVVPIKEPKTEVQDEPMPLGVQPAVAALPPPATSRGGGIENMSMDSIQAMQGQQWMMDQMINQQDQQMSGYAGGRVGGANNYGGAGESSMMAGFSGGRGGDANNFGSAGESSMGSFSEYNLGTVNPLWSSSFFPGGI